MILKEFLGSANLTKAQVFYIYKLTGVIIFNKNKDYIFITFQVVMLSLKSLNNSYKLLFIGFIIGLNKDQLLKKKRY